ncbi:MAG: hypothetical protein JWN82_536 [Candidatus Saccharibacteria bacterium]|nr:hypothetical protein [Candidatus Saccharibacteria bacterium]
MNKDDWTKLPVFKDANGRIAIWQRPNIPLIGWILFKAISLLTDDQHLKHGSASISTAFLFVWAYLEITKGINYFRRVAGFVVLCVIVSGFFRS